MRKALCSLAGLPSLAWVLLALVGWGFVSPPAPRAALRFPYAKAGLTKAQAAAHLLNRFTHGPRPGEVEAVVAMGLEKWLEEQLAAQLPETALTQRLSQGYPALSLSNEATAHTYLRADQVLARAVNQGLISRDSVKLASTQPEYRARVQAYMDSLGLSPMVALHRQLVNQKFLRAAYAENQVQEVLTDFWFNHFNVSVTKGQCQQYVLTYERDAIRPHALGRFYDLLEATAQHPAMLLYLDNASSVSNNNALVNPRLEKIKQNKLDQKVQAMEADSTQQNQAKLLKQIANLKKNEGLNENYAREVMELHTLGVDGGYTQADVTAVARALTGWTLYPLNDYGAGSNQRRLLERVGQANLEKRGFVFKGDFLFRADKHDQGEKTILGKTYPAGGGYEEGVAVLQTLANHPSTALFIARKLATRFVCDSPSTELVTQLAKVFQQTGGDTQKMILALVASPAFWEAANKTEKVKSPFELVVSAVRAAHADVQEPFQLFNWCSRMGQRVYYYPAPTGFPDQASYWVNAGALLNRMNFGLAFATGKIPGVRLNWAQLNHHHEPESPAEALTVYSQILMPQRDAKANVQRLLPLVQDAGIGQKIAAAADQTKAVGLANKDLALGNNPAMGEAGEETLQLPPPQGRNKKAERAALSRQAKAISDMPYTVGTNSPLAQVAGILIGSPAFQRK